MAELAIWMDDQLIGVLDGRDRRNLRVTYDSTWIANPTSTPLSVSMPLATRSHSGKVVESYLWGLLPDNDRVLARWAIDYQCSATDVFAFLEHVGGDVAGAAVFLPPDSVAGDGGAGAVEPLSDDDVGALLRHVRADATAWHPGARGWWSLAGAQGKLALAHDEATGRWGLPSGRAATTHILKPAIAGLDHHDLNEHLCLVAAGQLGLPVAATRVQRIGGEPALVVRRYDRIRRADGVVHRVHQEDCCQALGVHPARKYQADGGPGLEQMTALLREVIITNANRDIDTLLKAAAYNWLILGTDAHAKNYSLLLSGPQVRLAPLYDVASAALYGQHPRKLRMAQKIGDEYRPARIAGRHWDRLAKTARRDPDELRATIGDFIHRLPDALSDALAATEVHGPDRAAGEALLDALAGWITNCRRAMA